ncbi:Dynactin subunit 1 [Bulinus truncatus]|nr:Dynactin subunit 1 [Bulinus truncatus]
MNSLTPLQIPKKPASLTSSTGFVNIGDVPDASTDLNKLIQKTKLLLQNANKLSACPRVVDISSCMPGFVPATQNSGPMRQIISRSAELTVLEKNTQELQVQMTTLLASNRSGGQVRTDFSTFPTPQFAKMLHEKTNNSVKLGTIRIPTTSGTGDVIPLHLQPDQLRLIHEKMIM